MEGGGMDIKGNSLIWILQLSDTVDVFDTDH